MFGATLDRKKSAFTVGKSGVGQTKAKNDTAIHSEVRLTAFHNFLRNEVRKAWRETFHGLEVSW
jgi:hypothetical protein